ncbi:MAG: hypothetical protein GYB41_07780 [Oceanospirillales bacterium]|uniref:Twitching motility protein PilI n=1 Tax=Marinobacterium halophilum TaxID=267374 RepID=A0A2P8ESI7_9GAMM|nr:chemotaxis protein CheW [Marinobacterium halophilum]MBR9828526.1 hypothetical protein [Oceanospirillales bacterium]PSL12412.1 twitching motility protein PilI [Marinobacterium halophilum]
MDDFSLSRLPEPRVYSNEYEAPEFDEIRHGFLLDDQHFLLTTGTFSELAPKGRICPLPDSPVWFAGFINHRGNTVPVYDLPYLVHQERTDLRAQYWILLLGQQSHTAGFLLSEFPVAIIDPKRLNENLALSAAPKVLQPFLTAQYSAQGATWYEFDHQELLKKLKQSFYQPATLFTED